MPALACSFIAGKLNMSRMQRKPQKRPTWQNLLSYLRKPNTWFFLVVLGIALFWRLKGLWTREVWYDEVLDVLQASESIPQIFREVPTPVHYIIVHFFLDFGKNTFWLGLPSVFFGCLTVILVYFLGTDLYNSKKVGLTAMFLAAISPMMTEFSQQILHYSYLLFFSTLSFYIFTRLFIIQKPLARNARILLFLALLLVNVINY